MSRRRIVDDQLAAGDEPLCCRDPGDVMGKWAQCEQSRVRSVAPIAHHLARIRHQCVLGMHHAFGRAGRSRGESEIGDLVGISDRLFARGSRPGKIRQHIHASERARRAKSGVQLGAIPRAGERRLGNQGAGLQIRDTLCDLRSRIGAVERGVARVALARAGEEREDRFEAVREPDRDAVPAGEPLRGEFRGDAVGPREGLGPSQAMTAVPQRGCLRPLASVAGEQRIERIGLPQPLGVIAPRGGRMVEREKRTHCSSAELQGIRLAVFRRHEAVRDGTAMERRRAQRAGFCVQDHCASPCRAGNSHRRDRAALDPVCPGQQIADMHLVRLGE